MLKHKNGIVGSVIFHIVLVIMLIFLGFSTPLPLPGEEGILINFGDSDMGRGTTEPKKAVEKPVQQATPQKEVEQNLTQDFEEAPSIPIKKETKQQTKTPELPKKPTKEEPVEKPREVDKRTLYSGNGTSASSGEGTTEGNKNQGDETGTSESQSHFVGGSSGGGTEFSLSGRQKLHLSEPRLTLQKEGKVVVEITVDRAGNVVNARPGVQGSTSLDSDLLNLAKQAALKSKFSAKNDAAFSQKGTITYYFKLR